eukprot:SAG31_NODE_46961_length_252_cov_0.679739_1_plen_65_part_10
MRAAPSPHPLHGVRATLRGKSTGNRLSVLPTFGHHMLAALEGKDMLHHWLQQNHDRLAQKAGFPQ